MTRRLLILLLPAALLATSCSSLSVAAATVNGQKITESEVEKELNTLRDDPVFGEALKRDPDARGQRRREILRELIYQAVSEQEAKRMHLSVTQAKADKFVREAARSRGTTVEKLLDGENLSMGEARRLAMRGVRRFALIDEVVKTAKVPDAQVRQVYEGQKERFNEVHLEKITVKTQAQARAILTELNAGADFSRIAREKSTDEFAKEGGDMGYVPQTALDVQVQDAVSSAVEGSLTDPIQGTGVFEIYRLVDRRTKSFDDVADEIRQALTQDDRDQRFEFWLAERVRKAKVVVNPKYGRFDKNQAQPTVVPASPVLSK